MAIVQKLIAAESCSAAVNAEAGPSSPPPSLEPTNKLESAEADTVVRVDEGASEKLEAERVPLKPLTDLLWPPEPDPSIFTDPLKRDDPKPLRHEELLRIGTLH